MPRHKNPVARESLLKSAKELICTKGILSLSHEQLAKFHGISKSTCVHYFPTKDSLWQALAEDYVAHLDSELERFLKPYEEQNRPNALHLAFRDWYKSFRRPNNPWRRFGYQLMMLGADNQIVAEPIRDWYRRLFAQVTGQSNSALVSTMLLMVFDHLFNVKKCGYNVLDTEMEDRIMDRLILLSDELSQEDNP